LRSAATTRSCLLARINCRYDSTSQFQSHSGLLAAIARFKKRASFWFLPSWLPAFHRELEPQSDSGKERDSGKRGARNPRTEFARELYYLVIVYSWKFSRRNSCSCASWVTWQIASRSGM